MHQCLAACGPRVLDFGPASCSQVTGTEVARRAQRISDPFHPDRWAVSGRSASSPVCILPKVTPSSHRFCRAPGGKIAVGGHKRYKPCHSLNNCSDLCDYFVRSRRIPYKAWNIGPDHRGVDHADPANRSLASRPGTTI